MLDESSFYALLAQFARVDRVSADDVLFGSGINISSIRFTEFIMELEERTDEEIDIDDLDNSIKTAGQLYTRLSGS